MSAASASIFLSTSHSETTSTGATWRSRNRLILPYQPVPIRPTRFVSGAANAAAEAGPPAPARTSPLEVALAWRDSGRFMALLPAQWLVADRGETSPQDRATSLACQLSGSREHPIE